VRLSLLIDSKIYVGYTKNMRVMVVYRPNSEHGRMVSDFLRDLARLNPSTTNKVEEVNVDTREGSAVASLYDVMSYPKVMVVADDGRLIQDWESGTLPLLNDISFYINQSDRSLQMV
jgi:hypothetical protein